MRPDKTTTIWLALVGGVMFSMWQPRLAIIPMLVLAHLAFTHNRARMTAESQLPTAKT